MKRPARAPVLVTLLAISLAVCGCERPTESAPAGPIDATTETAATATTTVPGSTRPVAAAAPATRELIAEAPPVAAEKQPAGQDKPAPDTQPAEYEYKPGSPDGIGKWYMGREIAHVMGHQAAGWLERPEREEEERPSRLIEILKKRIDPDDVFADIGAGTGYYSFRLAPLVPKGKVFAVDIQQEMLDLLGEAIEKKGVKNVEPVLGTVKDPNLPAGSVDYVLLVDAYHEFDHPREMTRAIRKALKPGGKVLLVEFRGEDPNVPIKALHKMTEAQAKRELHAAGLKHVETIKQLPWQHVMVFEKPK